MQAGPFGMKLNGPACLFCSSKFAALFLLAKIALLSYYIAKEFNNIKALKNPFMIKYS